MILARPSMFTLTGLALAFATAACTKKSPPPEPFKGPLTHELVMASKDVASLSDSWDEALAKLQAKVGAPTKIDGKKYFWAAMKGDECAYFYILKEDGKAYGKEGFVPGGIMDPASYGPDGAIMNRAECLDLVGKGIAPEDPQALGAPTDGSAVTVKVFLANVVPARSRWEGKVVKVTGVLRLQVMTMSGQPPQQQAFLFAEDDPQHTIDCNLDAPIPDSLHGQPVTATGTVKLTKAVTGAGHHVLDGSLEHCALVATPSASSGSGSAKP